MTESGATEVVATADPPPRTTPGSRVSSRRGRGLAGHAVESLETVLTALIMAFVFRAFLVEAFIIPTGSMAESLLGAHATQLCPNCGWEFDYAPSRASPTEPLAAPAYVPCPNCHAAIDVLPGTFVPKDGDRILVHKWPYVLGGPLAPKRWDVIVFRDPADANQNYIKRLVGLPGETIEILGGDLFVDGQIARKTAAAQEALWFVVHDQSHVCNPEYGAAFRPPWTADESADADGRLGWTGLNERVIRWTGAASGTVGLNFNRAGPPLYSQDMCGYNQSSSGAEVCDIRIRFELTLCDASSSPLNLILQRGTSQFKAEVGRDRAALTLGSASATIRPMNIGSASWPASPLSSPILVEFGHVDYRVYLKLDGHEVISTNDGQYGPDVTALRAGQVERASSLRIEAGTGRLELRGLRVDRDVFYTRSNQTRRACPGSPFTLRSDEFFVLGDNSPCSHDGREWDKRGPHLPDDYRPGTVVADQIVGRAFFVYLPGLLPVDAGGRWRLPDLGRVRFIR